MSNATKTLTAADFASNLSHPVFFYAGVGAPGGETIAILEDTELPVSLDDLTGRVVDGFFEADNLASGDGAGGWKFTDWNGNTIYKVQVFDDCDIWFAVDDVTL